MICSEEAVLLRIFIGESDEYRGCPLHESVVLKAREMRMAGATVLRGPIGFGRSSQLHTAKILRLSEDLPMVIELVDSEPRIAQFLGATEEMLGSSLITTEKVGVVRFAHGRGPNEGQSSQ